MWKSVIPGALALVTLGLSLVSGEVIRREAEPRASEHKQLAALAQTSEPSPANRAPEARASAAAAARVESTARVALVIGNAAYPDAGVPLAQPVNNARALANELRAKGFDVTVGEDLRKPEMEQAIETFKSKVTPGSTALIFFSGFGIQAGRKTHILPVNAQIWNEIDVKRSGINLEPVLADIDARGARIKLVVLDASRRNPYERRFRSHSTGLAAVHAPNDTLVMYSAAPGQVVNDGEGEISPLVNELIAQLRASDQSVEEAFNHTRIAVSRATQRGQVPWVSSSLVEDVVLSAPAAAPDRHSARQ